MGAVGFWTGQRRQIGTLIASATGWLREIVNRGQNGGADAQPAHVTIKRTYRFIFENPPAGWTTERRQEIFNRITARLRNTDPAPCVRTLEVDHTKNCWLLTLSIVGQRNSPDNPKRSVAHLVDKLNDQARVVLSAANSATVRSYSWARKRTWEDDWEWPKDKETYLQSTIVCIDLDDPMARSLQKNTGRQNTGRLRRRLEEAVKLIPDDGASRPTFDHDAALGADSTSTGPQLILKSNNGCTDAEKVAAAVLREVPPVQPFETVLDTWRTSSVRYWGSANLILIAMSLVLARLRVDTTTLILASVVLLTVVVAAARVGYVRGARLGRTLLGLTPIFIVISFAIIYSWLSTTSPGMTSQLLTSPRAEAPPTWVDDLLLSLDVASFGGFLDLQPHSLDLRWAAYVEMLLMASVGGVTLYHTARLLWSTIQDLRRPAPQG